MRNLNFYINLALVILSFTSCAKYLDKKQSNASVIPSTLGDLQALLDDANPVMNFAVTPSYGEASADDYFLRPASYATLGSWQQSAYKWEVFAYNYPNDWSYNYSPIYNSNFCLDMIQKIERGAGNSREWDNVYGSALFYRSYFFLQLVWVFSPAYDAATAGTDKGIVLRLGSDFNVPSKRATVQETYDRIITDTKESASYLPNLPAHTFRPSRAAAYGLLARAYLSMRLYDSAYKYADLSLKIWDELMDFNGGAGVGNLTANFPFAQFNKETLFYTEMNNAGTGLIIADSRSGIDTALVFSYDAQDLRRRAYYSFANGFYTFKASYTQGTKKFSGITTAEMYLIRAESAARLAAGTSNNSSMLQSANADLNQLLIHRYEKGKFEPIELSEPRQLLDTILAHRRRELVFRGLRFIDIKRLNKEGRGIVQRRKIDGKDYVLQPNSKYYALPLPNDITLKIGIEQNEY